MSGVGRTPTSDATSLTRMDTPFLARTGALPTTTTAISTAQITRDIVSLRIPDSRFPSDKVRRLQLRRPCRCRCSRLPAAIPGCRFPVAGCRQNILFMIRRSHPGLRLSFIRPRP